MASKQIKIVEERWIWTCYYCDSPSWFYCHKCHKRICFTHQEYDNQYDDYGSLKIYGDKCRGGCKNES